MKGEKDEEIFRYKLPKILFNSLTILEETSERRTKGFFIIEGCAKHFECVFCPFFMASKACAQPLLTAEIKLYE